MRWLCVLLGLWFVLVIHTGIITYRLCRSLGYNGINISSFEGKCYDKIVSQEKPNQD